MNLKGEDMELFHFLQQIVTDVQKRSQLELNWNSTMPTLDALRLVETQRSEYHALREGVFTMAAAAAAASPPAPSCPLVTLSAQLCRGVEVINLPLTPAQQEAQQDIDVYMEDIDVYMGLGWMEDEDTDETQIGENNDDWLYVRADIIIRNLQPNDVNETLGNGHFEYGYDYACGVVLLSRSEMGLYPVNKQEFRAKKY
jgi:hypothetical protein